MTPQIMIALLAATFEVTHSASWTYTEEGGYGPSNWNKVAAACDGKRQSPIDVVTSKIEHDPKLGDITFHNYDVKPVSMTLKNDGHTAVVLLNSNMQLTGSGFVRPYIPRQFHFHWGSAAGPNSEHYIDGRRFPLEIHTVHFDSGHNNLTEAVNHNDAIAATSFMFEISDTDNEALETHLLSHFDKIPNANDEYTITPFALDKILPPPEERKHFYRYYGSVTTPNCWESVIWTLFTGRLKISERQMQKFYNLNASGGQKKIIDNSRPLQLMHGRKVYSNHVVELVKDCENSATSLQVLPSVITLLLAFRLF